MLKRAISRIGFKHIGIVVLLFISLILLKWCQNKNNIEAEDQFTSEISNEANFIPDEVDFNLHVRPLLSNRCFACHGPDANKRDSGFRLDTEDGAYAALNDRPDLFGIVPSNAEKSEDYYRNSRYWSVLYDEYRGYYYILVLSPIEIDKYNRGVRNMNLSMLILNEQFEKLGEVTLDNVEYNLNSWFINEKAIHIP